MGLLCAISAITKAGTSVVSGYPPCGTPSRSFPILVSSRGLMVPVPQALTRIGGDACSLSGLNTINENVYWTPAENLDAGQTASFRRPLFESQ